jgi:hypothetical protein
MAEAAIPDARDEIGARRATRLFLLVLAVLLVLQAGINIVLNPSGAFRASGLLTTEVRSSYAYQKLHALDEFLERTQGVRDFDRARLVPHDRDSRARLGR